MIGCRLARLMAATLFLAGVVQTASAQGQPQTPGPEHEKLKSLVGTWDAVVSTPGGGPESKGVAEYRMGVGGMWLISDFNGEMGGQKFVGHGMDSYDSAKKKYVSVWCDSMSGSPLQFEGTYDESGKVLTMHAESAGPDGSVVKMKSVSTAKDADHHGFQLFMMTDDPSAEGFEVVNIQYTRRKTR